jgi:hypothetical protein
MMAVILPRVEMNLKRYDAAGSSVRLIRSRFRGRLQDLPVFQYLPSSLSRIIVIEEIGEKEKRGSWEFHISLCLQ